MLAPGDDLFARHDWRDFAARLDAALLRRRDARCERVQRAAGGARRDWRSTTGCSCTTRCGRASARAELDRLLAALAEDDTGGLLAVPVADTLKRADRRRARGAHGAARRPVAGADAADVPLPAPAGGAAPARTRALVTDEAGAIEALGLKPKLVMGDPRNIKVTYPEDLALAELILESRAKRGEFP